jgi:hypothetical protein
MALDDATALGLSPVVREAMERFHRCETWESTARTWFLDDYKFSQADAYNGYQWPNEIRRNRDVDERPCLTINKVRQHNLQITNDMRQNKPSITFRATGGEATYASAQVYNAWIKHVEYRSRAQWWYDRCAHFEVNAGWAYLRLITEYVDNESDAQEVLIKGIRDPLTVYLDPDAKEPDKSDANFGFVFDDTSREEFEKEHPKWKDLAAQNALGDTAGWMGQDMVRRCEYYRRVRTRDMLYFVRGADGQVAGVRRSTLTKGGKSNKPYTAEMLQELENDPQVKRRPVEDIKVEYYLILGTKVVERGTWPGTYIPIAKVCAEETIIEGQYDCKSHTRALIDPQRMYNYWSSSAVEYGALQTKTPWKAPAEAIEGFETYWNNANTQNVAVLPYKSLREDGSTIPAPERIEPPVSAPVALQGMQIAQAEFAMASGQQEANFGQPGNERSALAQRERAQMGERATFHYLDGMALALQHVGRMALEVFPLVYDTRRVLMMMAEDGTEIELTIDPQAQQHHQQVEVQKQAGRTAAVQHTLNPKLGKYEVQAAAGPGYATQREEAFEAFKLILTQNPALTAILGDILFRAGDFPHAEEASQRLRRMVPPHALGEGPSPQEQQMMQAIQQLQGLLTKALDDLAKEKLKGRGTEGRDRIAAYQQFTNRLGVLLNAKLQAAKIAVDGMGKASQAGAGADGARTSPAITPEDIRGIMADLMPDLLSMDLAVVPPPSATPEPLQPDFSPPQPPKAVADALAGHDYAHSQVMRVPGVPDVPGAGQ